VKLEVLTIGTELLLGHTVDTNAAELGRALAAAGAEIVRRTTVPDRPEAIRAAVAEALERTGFVITTGGLGPTRDDMTKTVVAELMDKRLVLDERLLASIEERFKRMGRPMPAMLLSELSGRGGVTPAALDAWAAGRACSCQPLLPGLRVAPGFGDPDG